MNRAFSMGARILAISYAVFALVACGGSGGGGTIWVRYSLGHICLQGHSVGGTVSGLAGSGLVLNSIGDSVAISVNGSFTFPTKIAETDGYDVAVSTQPVNPSQTCVVTNGRGVVGSSNVTDISVVCTTGVANANLKGTFTAVRYDWGGSFGDGGDLWSVTFDGAGNFSGTLVVNGGGNVGSGAVSGTYTVAADGTLNISPARTSTITGGLSADGNTLLTSQTNAGVSPEVLVGIKHGQANFSNGNLKGTYEVVIYDDISVGDNGSLLTLTFNGAGVVTGTGVQNSGGLVSSVAVSGTYTVAAEGTLTISGVDLGPLTGGLSVDGNTLVASQTTSGHSPSILVGILR